MIAVYALYNEINSEIYIGITLDIIRRLQEHNSGKSRYTKAFKPWKVFYTEECENYPTARNRELFFKTSTGRRELKRRLLEYKLLNTK
jgi:putative endonuclease